MFDKNLSLPDGESNPGLPRDRRGYLPLYYRGLADDAQMCMKHVLFTENYYRNIVT